MLVTKGPPVIVGLTVPVANQRRTRPVFARCPVMSLSNRVEVTDPTSAVGTTASAATMLMGDGEVPVLQMAVPLATMSQVAGFWALATVWL